MELDIQDMMATEKLADGNRGFTVDQIKLEKMLAENCENDLKCTEW